MKTKPGDIYYDPTENKLLLVVSQITYINGEAFFYLLDEKDFWRLPHPNEIFYIGEL